MARLTIELLASHAPASLLRRLASGALSATEASAAPAAGAVLFADIAGFTPLAERLAVDGPPGAERLARILNAAFDRIIELVAAHGGEVVRFAGDATLGLFEASSPEPPALEAASLRAARCALALREAFLAYETGEGGALRVRVGLAAGALELASVGGGEERWEFLVAGEPLALMGAALRAAKPGEVVVAGAARHHLREHAVLSERPGSCSRLEEVSTPAAPAAAPAAVLPEALAPFVRRYVSRSLLARLEAGHGEWLAEFRRVTVMFVNLTDLAATGGAELARLQAATRALQTAVYRYGGSVNQYLVDDKGTTLVAAWGLPASTHEDDRARAVLAALEARRELGAAGIAASIGLATGRVFCGRRGNPRRSEYALIGDTINLAARLTAGAPGGITCDAETAGAAGERVAFAAGGELKVKGKTLPIAVHHPIKERRAAERSGATLVGREEQRARLIAKLTELVTERRGGVVLIEGAAGMGKSALIRELVSEAEAMDGKRAGGPDDPEAS